MAFGINCDTLYTERDMSNLRRFQGFLIGWAAVLVTSILLIDRWVAGVAAWALVALGIVLSLATVRSYFVFLREADELLRKVHVDGLALGFGAGLVFSLGYRMLERVGAPRLDVSDSAVVMMTFFAIGQWIGLRRYVAPGDEA